jgi:hypothetical protein
VQNLWLVKFKIINNGDITIVGKGKNSNILDSTIKFSFKSGIEILDKIESIQSDFPHQLVRFDSATLSLSFQQWKKNESGTYSIYLKSITKSANVVPSVDRVLIDGDFNIVDQTKSVQKVKQPLIDTLIGSPFNLVGRILGFINCNLWSYSFSILGKRRNSRHN